MRSRYSILMTIFPSNFEFFTGNRSVAFFVSRPQFPQGGNRMKIRKKILDFEYEEVLDVKTRELIRVGCAVAVGCPT
jgi:alkylhydroperoxidase/carboxymuconolactone decarboxylase family protein YurZ